MSKLAKALTAAAGNAGESLYVEDVFSTYLYTGTGSALTITNGIDLDGEGGLVWIKQRDGGFTTHNLYDTERGTDKRLDSSTTSAEATPSPADLASFLSSGFSLGTNGTSNGSGGNYASWTFRKAKKFFDVVTYTGTGSVQNITHNLGSVPACIIIKKTSSGGDYWNVYHSSLGNTKAIFLNDGNEPVSTSSVWWNNTTPTDSVFTVGTAGGLNASGSTMVAYLFASDAGGFGDDGSESIIKCGSYVGNGSTDGPVIDLGFEPQWVMIKRASAAGTGWYMHDIMRGMPNGGTDSWLEANSSAAEVNSVDWIHPTATGFNITNTQTGVNASGDTYIYIAIRRPMKTPESGTEVFAIDTGAQTTAGIPWFEAGFPPDFAFVGQLSSFSTLVGSRLMGTSVLAFANTNAETTQPNQNWDYMTGYYDPNASTTYYAWMFKRAPGFMDVVAYTATQTVDALPHNLGVPPEMAILKRRDGTTNWVVWHKDLTSNSYEIFLNKSDAEATPTSSWNNANPASATTFTIGVNGAINTSGAEMIMYLFATLDGISKVGSYTGTAADLNVDCGFSAGARFILIKRSDSTGDWYLYDSTRGIVAGDDPYLLLNSTAAEVTNTDYIDPLASGFTVTSNASGTVNVSGGTYIFLAIA